MGIRLRHAGILFEDDPSLVHDDERLRETFRMIEELIKAHLTQAGGRFHLADRLHDLGLQHSGCQPIRYDCPRQHLCGVGAEPDRGRPRAKGVVEDEIFHEPVRLFR